MSRRLFKSLALTALIVAVAVAAPKQEGPFTDADRSYWAFQPIKKPSAPSARYANPIDRFLEPKRAEKGLTAAPRADRVTLIRRAYFDLIGLPPTPEQVEAFVRDESPRAWAKVIDDLLASPHYGERWARHWLDLARYADSNGFKTDETRPNAWRYRDYLIESFNSDKPYDRFVQEQIAGDELWPESSAARVATAFNRHYPDESNAANLLQRRAEILQDVTDAVGATFMGLTVGCAKCHDHKFDPILQKDYYRLQAFFAATAEDDAIPMLEGEELSDYQNRLADWEEATAEIRAEMKALTDKVAEDRFYHLYGKRTEFTQDALLAMGKLTPMQRQMRHKHDWQFEYEEAKLAAKLKGPQKDRYAELEGELARYDYLHPGELPIGIGMRDLGSEAPETHVLGLANYAVEQEETPPGFLSLLDPSEAKVSKPESLDSTGRRTALAKWLTSDENPLTSRVMVNRIWQHHFGRGIVATPSDFGRMGERPTHPELLDWLASEFVDQGWSMKQMHRLIMSSEAYQQESAYREDAAKRDPFNKLLWRFTPQRLEGEVIRDSMLAASGMLNTRVGGPSVMPPLPEGMPTPRGGWNVAEELDDQRRRSVYIFVRRNKRFPMMEAFDLPDTHLSCARRDVTTTAPQALALLNDSQTMDWAAGLAERVVERAGLDAPRQVQQAFLLAYSRRPDADEKDAAYTFLESQRELISERAAAGEPIARLNVSGLDEAQAAALVDFCHALMNSNEFVYRD